eukprot:2211285-Pyramimonas_sp.AAC.1
MLMLSTRLLRAETLAERPANHRPKRALEEEKLRRQKKVEAEEGALARRARIAHMLARVQVLHAATKPLTKPLCHRNIQFSPQMPAC